MGARRESRPLVSRSPRYRKRGGRPAGHAHAHASLAAAAAARQPYLALQLKARAPAAARPGMGGTLDGWVQLSAMGRNRRAGPGDRDCGGEPLSEVRATNSLLPCVAGSRRRGSLSRQAGHVSSVRAEEGSEVKAGVSGCMLARRLGEGQGRGGGARDESRAGGILVYHLGGRSI